MPRGARLILANIPVHIIQRGNSRQACFFSDEDSRFYLDWLRRYAAKLHCGIHAYVLMTNHVYLLLAAERAEGAGALMKGLGQRYMQYVNRTYRRSGMLREGRFRSCLIQERQRLRSHRPPAPSLCCAAATLLSFARDPKWLGVEPALTWILHTWDQPLRLHRHVHGLISGGGLTEAGAWVSANPHFLFPVRALARVFRGRFLEALAAGLRRGALRLPAGQSATDLLAELTRQDGVVHAKPPFAGPRQVLAYLGRYTHRTALGPHRRVAMAGEAVTFRWRDRTHGDQARLKTLPAEAFVDRVLLHVLPKGFQRLRHPVRAGG